jgi:amidase
MIDLSTDTASDAVAALSEGAVGSEELLDAQLARVDLLNPDINAVVALDIERARSLAREADAARARGESWGPLHGLPMTIKDAFETEGLVTTCGAPELADHVPTVDADAVARLKAAGAIVFAKTNVPIYAGDVQTYNEVYGLTRNPWDLERAPGGSSGGAAAALATGMTLLELGSDIGGSIRNPSHYSGVFGHKPTWGVVSQRGHIPGPPGTLAPADLNVVGPMGRSVADLVLGLDVLQGDVLGVPGARVGLARPELRSLSDLRVGVWLDDPYAPTDRAVLDVLERAVAELESAGATVVDGVRPTTSLEEQTLTYLALLISVVSAGYPASVRSFLAEVVAAADPDDRSTATVIARSAILSHAHWLGANERRHRIEREWESVFADVDVLLTPVTPVAAIPHDTERPMGERTVEVNGAPADYLTQLVWAGLATMPRLPATVVPAGRTAGGLPVGLQLVGPRYGDRVTLRAAGWAESVLGGFTPPPPPSPPGS